MQFTELKAQNRDGQARLPPLLAHCLRLTGLLLCAHHWSLQGLCRGLSRCFCAKTRLQPAHTLGEFHNLWHQISRAFVKDSIRWNHSWLGYQGAQVWVRGSSMWLQSANSWSSVQDFHKIMLSFFNIHWKIKFLWAGPFSLWWHVILQDSKRQAVCKPGAPPTQCLKTRWRMPGLRLGSWSARGAVLSHTPWGGSHPAGQADWGFPKTQMSSSCTGHLCLKQLNTAYGAGSICHYLPFYNFLHKGSAHFC